MISQQRLKDSKPGYTPLMLLVDLGIVVDGESARVKRRLSIPFARMDIIRFFFLATE
jgi:hypothetical protein